MGGNGECLSNELRMFKEENTMLRGKTSKAKIKRATVEEELKQYLKEEMVDLKLKASRNNGVEKVCLCFALFVIWDTF